MQLHLKRMVVMAAAVMAVMGMAATVMAVVAMVTAPLGLVLVLVLVLVPARTLPRLRWIGLSGPCSAWTPWCWIA